tara:strand:- start:210 stop:785 length:576 start_codon:yes stop_codon:yes gene_type:complete
METTFITKGMSSRIGMSNSKIMCNPLNDSNKRFVIGKAGNKELLAIGLNPSTANEYKLDPTSKNIQTIAKNNGCDGWWLINLYPKRTSKPENLPKKININLAKKNICVIRKLLNNDSYSISRVLCCWGNHVEDHNYLKDQAKKIISLVNQSGHKNQCIGLTRLGNPFHPSPLAVNRFFGGITNVKLKNYCS